MDVTLGRLPEKQACFIISIGESDSLVSSAYRKALATTYFGSLSAFSVLVFGDDLVKVHEPHLIQV